MPTRRRIDQILEPGFAEGLDALDVDELRRRRLLARDVENELSYYRRLLHGRMDLIRFEQRRRRGEETQSLIQALPQILADQPASAHRGRHIVTDLPPLPDVGRRELDSVLGDDVLTRLDEVGDAELASALEAIGEVEADISERRRLVQEAEDALAAHLAARYRDSGSDLDPSEPAGS